MAGLIGQAMGPNPEEMAPEQMPQEPMPQEAPPQGDEAMGGMDPDSIRQNMKIPEKLQAAYDKVIKAGLKVMLDPSNREETASFLEESGGDPVKLAEGITAVIVTLYQQSNRTIPPNLLIPAGIELCAHSADLASKSGMELPKEDVAEMMAEVVQQILVKFGATPEQMQKMMSGMDSQQAPEAPEAPAPEAPPEMPPQPPMGQAPQGV